MDGKPDLRPCPFCGGYARLVRCYNGWVPEHPTYMVVCDKCTAQGLKTKEPEIVVKAWNRRAEPETAHGAPENRALPFSYQYTCRKCGWETGEQAERFRYCPMCGEPKKEV